MQIHETALIFDVFLGGFVLFCLFLLRLHNEVEFRFLICLLSYFSTCLFVCCILSSHSEFLRTKWEISLFNCDFDWNHLNIIFFSLILKSLLQSKSNERNEGNNCSQWAITFCESKSEYRLLCDARKRSPIKVLGNAGLPHDLFRCLSWLCGPVAEKSYTHCATSPMPVLAIFFYEILNHSIWESRTIYYLFGRATYLIEDCFQVGQLRLHKPI